MFIHEAIARSRIDGRLGNLLEAKDWQQRAYAVLITPNYEHLRPK